MHYQLLSVGMTIALLVVMLERIEQYNESVKQRNEDAAKLLNELVDSYLEGL